MNDLSNEQDLKQIFAEEDAEYKQWSKEANQEYEKNQREMSDADFTRWDASLRNDYFPPHIAQRMSELDEQDLKNYVEFGTKDQQSHAQHEIQSRIAEE